MRKSYTAEKMSNNGVIFGGIVITVWFWFDAATAHKLICDVLEDGQRLVNFRRV